MRENPAPESRPDTDWQCSICKVWHPITQLARDCEQKHTARMQ